MPPPLPRPARHNAGPVMAPHRLSSGRLQPLALPPLPPHGSCPPATRPENTSTSAAASRTAPEVCATQMRDSDAGLERRLARLLSLAQLRSSGEDRDDGSLSSQVQRAEQLCSDRHDLVNH